MCGFTRIMEVILIAAQLWSLIMLALVCLRLLRRKLIVVIAGMRLRFMFWRGRLSLLFWWAIVLELDVFGGCWTVLGNYIFFLTLANPLWKFKNLFTNYIPPPHVKPFTTARENPTLLHNHLTCPFLHNEKFS